MRIKKNQAKAARSNAAAKSVLLSALILPTAGTLNAQPTQLEEVVVTGTRQVIQSTIAIKRDATQVVDGLSAADIGDIPALSIGEALETISGVSSHRENGGATEVSIRGLGPYLSSTTFNGRAATNGSGDRSVNFSQFPSELMSKLAVFKTQDASQIEGGVAGQIQLETLKPLDYNKRRFQIDAKANWNPDQQNIDNSMEGDLGHRLTGSYVDQFEFDNGAAIGISLGIQNSEISQPEQEVRSSSPTGTSLFACINDPNVTDYGVFTNPTDNCEDNLDGSDRDFDTTIDPTTGRAVDAGSDYVFLPSSRTYRQNDTSDVRDSYFVALQIQPNDSLDINFDAQVSDRVQTEQRHDLNFGDQRRSITGVSGQSLVTNDTGGVLYFEGEGPVESNSETYFRDEQYRGGGISIEYDVNDQLRWSSDLSYSETTREERQILLRTQSTDSTIPYSVSFESGIPQYTLLQDFDITDHSEFTDRYRARIDHDVSRENTIGAFRSDFEYDIDSSSSLVTSVKSGFRISELEYLNRAAPTQASSTARLELEIRDSQGPTIRIDDGQTISFSDPFADDAARQAALAAINTACAIDSFPESNFLENVADGPIVTNSVSGEGTGNEWAIFDTECAAAAILGIASAADSSLDLSLPQLSATSVAATNVTETISAAYVMANYETSFADRPLRGNFGVRIVNTQVESVGYRSDLTASTVLNDLNEEVVLLVTALDSDDNPIITRDVSNSSYTEILPSFSYVLDLSDSVLLRGGIFKAMSRADPSDLSFNRTISPESDADSTSATTVAAAISESDISAQGNPTNEALTSWNADASMEWYANDDSFLAVGLYYKRFSGGFENVIQDETYVIDGEGYSVPVEVVETSDETSSIYGIEITGSHAFTYLPGFLSGFGFKGSYNYADSDFKFEDSNYGDLYDIDGNQTNVGIIDPASVPGLSEHVFSGQLYFQAGDFDIAAIYKYRSQYFQPYTSNGTRLRYVKDVGVWEARASYDLTDNIRVKLEAINLLDEPRVDTFYAEDNFGQASSYGSRVFLGLTAKF